MGPVLHGGLLLILYIEGDLHLRVARSAQPLAHSHLST